MYPLLQEIFQMTDKIRSKTTLESGPISAVRAVGSSVQNFRFVPESYFAAIGMDWDPGLDHLVYLRMLIEEETGEVAVLKTLTASSYTF
jgi:hypothetical protein